MPQSTQGKRWFALLIVSALAVSACAHRGGVNNAPFSAHTLKYDTTWERFPLEYRNFGILAGLLGANKQRLVRPVAIAARDRSLYIADAGEHLLYRFDLNTKLLHKIGDAGDQLTGEAGGIYVTANGDIYVTDPLGQRVLKFSRSGSLLQTFRDAANISRPLSVAVDEATGRVFVADEVFSHVVIFSPEGEPLQGIGARGLNAGPGNFRVITDMAMAPEGVYVTDRVELRVQLIGLDGKYVRNFGQSDLIFPLAIARDQYGRMFISDRSDNRLRVFDNQGQLIEIVGRNGSGPGEFRLANDMAIDGDRLYVADSLNGRIQVFKILPPAAAAPAG